MELLRKTCGLPLDLLLRCFGPPRENLLKTDAFSWRLSLSIALDGILAWGRELVNLLISLAVSAKIFPSPARTAPPLPAIV